MPAIEILFRDGAVCVVRKEAGVLSQKSERGEPGLTELLPPLIGGPVYPVHRLDRETAGVMVFAGTEKAAAALSGSIRAGAFHKEYLALLTRPMPEPEGVLEDYLFFDRSRGKVFPVKKKRAGVRDARLSYRTVAAAAGLTLVRVFPETGRTHQIRVQFAARGCPLAGDGRYGGGSGALALFCRSVAFPHPGTGLPLSFSALPEGGLWTPFADALAALPVSDKQGENLQ